jgi:hypothetical protein
MQELLSMPVTMGEGELEALPLPPVEHTNETNKETAKKMPTQPTVETLAAQPAKGMMQLALTAHSKLCAIIKPYAFRVREKQHALCPQVVEFLQHNTLLPLDRSAKYIDLPGMMRV